MKFDRLDLAALGLAAVLLIALAVVLLIGDTVGARVVAFTPLDGAEVGTRSPLTLVFAETMDAATVEAALAIEPAVDVQYIWRDTRVRIVPEVPLDAGTTYTVTLDTAAASESGRQLKRPLRWSFTTRAPSLAFLHPANGAREVWQIDADGAATQLTETEGSVFDFSVSPDGNWLGYSVVNDDNGLDLWVANSDGSSPRLLVACGLDLCYNPAFAPDGLRLAYSREQVELGQPPRPPRIWTASVENGETSRLYQDTQILGYGPSWSPNGLRLAFFDAGENGIRVIDLDTTEESVLPTWMGVVGTWSPDGNEMLFSDLKTADAGQSESNQAFQVSVYRVNFTTGELTVAFDDEDTTFDYGVPVWSPDGAWIAIGLRDANAGPGLQLWRMRPDGSEPEPISTDPGYTHGGYLWSPDSQQVVFQRLQLSTAFAVPEVLVWDATTGETSLLFEDATNPVWVP